MTRRECLTALAFAAIALPRTALAQDSPIPALSSSSHAPSSHSSEEEDAPSEARQLWSELYCMCGECEHMTLEKCTCDSAAKERKKIADRISELTANGKQGTARATVLKEYIARFGEESQLGHYQPKMRFMWPELLSTSGLVLLGGGVLFWLVERIRRRNAGAPTEAPVGRVFRPSGKKRRKRKS